jgi:hypothetical protein
MFFTAPGYTTDIARAPLQVGPQRMLKSPSAAASMARAGDIIEIDAGAYSNDYATWNQDNLTLRGVGGMAHLKSNGLIPNGKAIWIVSGNNTVIENVEFSGAAVADTNGAGIRHEKGSLTLRNTFFHNNEFSILTGKEPTATLNIQSSRFWFQKRANTFSHGLYIGALKRFTITGSHVKGTNLGHQIKSRALENHILYNRIEDVAGGNSSRLIDLPNCGLSFVMGNDMQQAETTQNADAIGFGAENCDGRTDRQQQLYVVNNTFVNEARSGTLVKNHDGGDVLVANNLVMGHGFFLLGKGSMQANVRAPLSKRIPDSWALQGGSKALDAAQTLLPVAGKLLVPTRQFNVPVGTTSRTSFGPLDIGSRELAQTAEPARNQP